MDEELQKAMADYFDVGDFAEMLGVTVQELIAAFPEEFDEAFDEILEIMEIERFPDEDERS